MIKYMEEKYGDQAKIGDKNKLHLMRQEVNRLESLYRENQKSQNNSNDNANSEKGSEHNTDEDDEDDYVEELPMPIRKDKGPRSSISAEAFG